MRRREKKATYKRMTRRKFLENVLLRLESDVGFYLDAIEKANRHVGFWALIRMLFPIIEAVATTIYRGQKSQRRTKFLASLGIRYPNLAWEIYRHSLIHNDELRIVRYRGRTVTWEVRIGGGHNYRAGHIGIDMRQLYDDLVKFLKTEIGKPTVSHVFIEDGINFGRGIRPLLKEEFSQIYKEP